MFDEKKYTEDSLRKQFLAIQLHGTDGSATEAGCNCVPAKHSLGVELFAEEGIMTAANPKEKEFYTWYAEIARKGRKSIEDGSFDIPHNPTSGECPKLVRCISKVSKKCVMPACNPYAVCRASVKCP
jgi:hypothetical protein